MHVSSHVISRPNLCPNLTSNGLARVQRRTVQGWPNQSTQAIQLYTIQLWSVKISVVDKIKGELYLPIISAHSHTSVGVDLD